MIRLVFLCLLVLPAAAWASSEEKRENCAQWTEELETKPDRRKWQREKVTAHQKAMRRPPGSWAEERQAEIVHYELKDVEVINSRSKPGSWNLYNSRSTFSVTFRRLPCDEAG